jgi:hypothetical protein
MVRVNFRDSLNKDTHCRPGGGGRGGGGQPLNQGFSNFFASQPFQNILNFLRPLIATKYN